MKKLTVILLALLMCVFFSACNKPDVEVEETTTHTIPATQPPLIEPEWAEVNCDIALIDPNTNTTILYGEDFSTFAVIGTTDEDSYITIKTTDAATQIINSMDELPTLQLVINGDTRGDIVLKPDSFTGEFSFGHNLPYEALCQLASSIRGLF
ncbi:MAG: hypothetical protein IJ015_03810 [Ruminococcus sp.]|nr:hypothetical protein [Ruminococcus sp.]